MKILKNSRGYALLLVLLTITIIGIIGVILSNQILTTNIQVKKSQENIVVTDPIQIELTNKQPGEGDSGENQEEGSTLPCSGGNKNKDLKGNDKCILTGPIVIADKVTLAGRAELIINGDVKFLNGADIQGNKGKITVNNGILTIDYSKVSGRGSIYLNGRKVW